MTFSADDLDESNARQIEKHTVPGFEYCGLGVCSAEGGHEGTCAQASGWDDEDD